MKICPNCQQQLDDQAMFCHNCGMAFNNRQPYAPIVEPHDHTAEFDPRDISDNKVLAMLPYLMGAIGIIVALLAINESRYVAFHVKQALKFIVVQALTGIIGVLLAITFIVPIAAAVCNIIIFVLQIIAFFQVCGGKAKEPAIIRDLGFLK